MANIPFAPAPDHAATAPARRPRARLGLVLALGLAAASTPATAGAPPFQARAGLDLARAAARAWAADAALVYVENDEPVDHRGEASRWAYLYYSASLGQARVYSVRNGKIVVAEQLEMQIEAPPVASDWIDSQAALEVAESNGGWEFRHRLDGRISAMLLMRSTFDEKEPDETTWTLVYSAPNQPSLFMVIDARERKVRRTWRG